MGHMLIARSRSTWARNPQAITDTVSLPSEAEAVSHVANLHNSSRSSQSKLTIVDNMSARIDSLENSIQDLMQDGIEGGIGHGMSPSSPPSAKR